MEQQRGLMGGGGCTAVGCVLTGLLGTSAHNDFQEAGVCVRAYVCFCGGGVDGRGWGWGVGVWFCTHSQTVIRLLLAALDQSSAAV